MATPAIRLILFDLGGVLIELGGMPPFLERGGGGRSADELWELWLRSEAVRAFESGRIGAEAFAEAICAELALPAKPSEWLAAFARWPRGLFPGALELVRSIPRRYARATLSNTNAVHWPRFLAEPGFAQAFDAHFPSHLTGKLKPDAAAFQHVMDATGFAAEEILFLDDNALNVDAALRLGLTAFRVRGVNQARERLQELGVIPGAEQR